VSPGITPEIARAVAILRSGGHVAFPTDTFYALGADALNGAAVRKVFQAKGRADGRPVPVLLADSADVMRVAREFPPLARALARRYWPGPLTLVLPAAPEMPTEVTAGGGSVGVRVPDHEMARTLIRAFGGPVTGTSANRSGGPPHKDAAGVRAALGGQVETILAGECGGHDAPSTVVDFSRSQPVLLREGAISFRDIAAVAPDVSMKSTP
jgi:L-threonylcarbamoyladenylate synthase